METGERQDDRAGNHKKKPKKDKDPAKILHTSKIRQAVASKAAASRKSSAG
jgi:hypothetical protein